jgi:2,4-dienoyl-CoA reductase-like NADH-dependent reductase (Old Yellow Enzyme family)
MLNVSIPVLVRKDHRKNEFGRSSHSIEFQHGASFGYNSHLPGTIRGAETMFDTASNVIQARTTVVEDFGMPGLFDDFRLKDVTLRNRIGVSPMCQYSADDGFPNEWHLVHLGSRAVGGAGLVIVEATAVSPEGRISPQCTGIWSDAHIEPYSHIAQFLKAHGSVPGIQLAHAGRKASSLRPWDGDTSLTPEQGAWPTIAPSAEAFGANLPAVPSEMTHSEIARVRDCFVSGAERALAAGMEWLELHFAHGYLAHSFFSPLSNHRTDEYGGDFEGRIRFLVETFEAVRNVWPERYPLTARLSVTDWVAGGITVEESIELIRRLKSLGLDLIDVSQGFVIPDISQIPWGPGFLVPIAGRIRREVEIPTAVGWMIDKPEQADAIVREGQADIVLLARAMLADPYWPYHAAIALNQDDPRHLLPDQYAFALKRR